MASTSSHTAVPPSPRVLAGAATGLAACAVGSAVAKRRVHAQAANSQATGSTLTTSLLNLSKNIIGAGMLSLPFAMKGAGVVPFVLGLMFMGALNAYTFYLLGWCCRAVGASSFGELWSKTFGPSSAWVADLSVLLNNGLACLAYCVLIGDFLSKALTGLLPGVALLHGRGADLVLVALLLLVPLSLRKDLAFLRYSSMAGLTATLYGFMLLWSDCVAKADFGNPAGPVLQNILPMRADFFSALALFSSAFMAHYNSPKIYADLQENTLSRWATLVGCAFSLAFITFTIFGFSGFALFGFSVEGNVLKNYSNSTRAMLAWLGMAFSVVFTYPLVFSTFRDSASALLRHVGLPVDTKGFLFRFLFTVLAVAMTVLGGTVFSDVALVNGVKGAVMSSCLAFIYPAVIHLRLTGPGGPVAGLDKEGNTKAMRTASVALLLVGVVSGILALLAMFVLPRTDFSKLAKVPPPHL